MDKELEKLPFWINLSGDQKQRVAGFFVRKKFSKGTYILGESGCKTCFGMIHVISGELRAYITSEDGREITLFSVGSGEDCVLSASCVLSQISFDTQLSVTKDCELLIIPSNIFGELMEDNIYVRCFSFEVATKRFSQVMWIMQQIIFIKFDKRLASFLISECQKTGTNRIKMTQEEIALQVNSAREVVTRMLKHFEKEDFVELKRGEIIIKDISALKQI